MLILSLDAWVRSTDVRKLNMRPIWCLWLGRIALETMMMESDRDIWCWNLSPFSSLFFIFSLFFAEPIYFLIRQRTLNLTFLLRQLTCIPRKQTNSRLYIVHDDKYEISQSIPSKVDWPLSCSQKVASMALHWSPSFLRCDLPQFLKINGVMYTTTSTKFLDMVSRNDWLLACSQQVSTLYFIED